MLNGILNILSLSAIAVMLVLVALRFIKRKPRDRFESFQAASSSRNAGIFERQRVPATKKCPACEAELPLATIICEGCDYNFLAARPVRSQRMLPSPEALPEELQGQRIASAL